MTIYYFGTDTRSAGHYFWEITEKGVTCKYLTFPEYEGEKWECYPFDPENLFNKDEKYQKGYVKFIRIKEYSVCAMVGSPIDSRQGCKSVFFIKEHISNEALKNCILSLLFAKAITDKLNPNWS